MDENEVAIYPNVAGMRQLDEWHKNRVRSIQLKRDTFLSTDRRLLTEFSHLRTLDIDGFVLAKLRIKTVLQITKLKLHNVPRTDLAFKSIGTGFPNVTKLVFKSRVGLADGFKKTFPALKSLKIPTRSACILTVDMDLDKLSMTPVQEITFVGAPRIKKIVIIGNFLSAVNPSRLLTGIVTTDLLYYPNRASSWVDHPHVFDWRSALSAKETVIRVASQTPVTWLLTDDYLSETPNPIRIVFNVSPTTLGQVVDIAQSRVSWANQYLTVETRKKPSTRTSVTVDAFSVPFIDGGKAFVRCTCTIPEPVGRLPTIKEVESHEF